MALDLSLKCNPDKGRITLCNKPPGPDNIWMEDGRCTLDEITYEIVIRVLTSVYRAGADLIEITLDPTLLELANKIGVGINEKEDNDILQRRISGPNTLHYYNVLRGNTDGSVKQ